MRFCSLFVLSSCLSEGPNRWEPLAEAGAVPARSVYPAGLSGRLGTRPHGHYDSCAGSSALLPVNKLTGAASAVRGVWDQVPRKHRGGAPQGAPVRVMGRQSLPLKGLAQPQGGHGCGVPHQRFAALRSPRKRASKMEETSQIPGAPRRGNEQPYPDPAIGISDNAIAKPSLT